MKNNAAYNAFTVSRVTQWHAHWQLLFAVVYACTTLPLRAVYGSDPPPTATVLGDTLILRKDLNGYPGYGGQDSADAACDILYCGQQWSWHFDLSEYGYASGSTFTVELYASIVLDDSPQEPPYHVTFKVGSEPLFSGTADLLGIQHGGVSAGGYYEFYTTTRIGSALGASPLIVSLENAPYWPWFWLAVDWIEVRITPPSSPPPPPAPNPLLDADTIALYQFEEESGTQALDATGNGWHGTLQNGVVRGFDAAAGLSYVAFDGIDDFISVNGTLLNNLPQGSIEAYVFLEGPGTSGWPIASKAEPIWTSFSWGPGGDRRVQAYVGTPGPFDGPSPLPLETWLKLGLIWDQSAVRLYIDGRVDAEYGTGAMPTTSGVELTLGRHNAGGNLIYFKGRLAQVRISRVARDLSGEQQPPPSSFCDDFGDGVIDTRYWVVGGARRGIGGFGAGSWQWSHEEIGGDDGALRMRVWGPESGLTYGADAWVRTRRDFNDGADHRIEFTWGSTISAWHIDAFAVEIANGLVPNDNNLWWFLSDAPGLKTLYTVNGLTTPSSTPPVYGLVNRPPTEWSIYIDGTAKTATLHEGPNLSGNVIGQKVLDADQPWYVQFVQMDATSAGFPAGDNSIYIYEFCSLQGDIEPPTVACPPTKTLDADGDCAAPVPDIRGEVLVTDNVTPTEQISLVQEPQPGTRVSCGTSTIRVTATDAAGNSSVCTTTLVVVDRTPPMIVPPADLIAGTDPGECSAVVHFGVQATDNCSPVSVVCNPPSGSTFPKGVTQVICTATDVSGNASTSGFNVTVNDTEGPTIACPADITLPATGIGGAVVTFDTTATDNCPGVSIGCSPASGTLFPLGATSVLCKATDAAGNASTCSFTVTVTGQELSALGPAKVWIGLKNSDDVGTKFDLLAEVFKNGELLGSGELDSVPGGSSGFNNAVSRTVNMALPAHAVLVPGDALRFRFSVRIAGNVAGHRSGTARLWFNDSAANSHFGVTLDGAAHDYFLLSGLSLGTSAGPGPKQTIDVFVDKAVGGNPFKPFGTWTKTF